jgi:hypothetical protein
MAENHKAGLPCRSSDSSAAIVTASRPESGAREDDASLLALEKRFNDLAAELARDVERLREEVGHEALTKQIEAILARMDPIERAIMETPACTIAGLGVKARHAAYVMSEYWEAPIDRIDWDARAVRLLIDAVCEFARTPLPVRKVRADE